MSSSSNNSNEIFNRNLEAKRRQNIEDNRRFLAALKINDIRDEIKEITTSHTDSESASSIGRRAVKKEMQSDIVRRSSRIRHNIGQIENVPPIEHKRKNKIAKNIDENRVHPEIKIKLKLPDHMLIRYQSTSKKVALHNTKAKFGDDDDDNENL